MRLTISIVTLSLLLWLPRAAYADVPQPQRRAAPQRQADRSPVGVPRHHDSMPRFYFEETSSPVEFVRSYEKVGILMLRGAGLAKLLEVAYEADPARFVYDVEIDRKRRFKAVIRPEDQKLPTARAQLADLLERRFDLTLRKERRKTDVMILRPRTRKTLLQAVAATGESPGFDVGPGELRASRAPISMLVEYIGRSTARPVVDQSGLEGLYDFHLQWDPGSGAYAFLQALGDLGLTLMPANQELDVWVVSSATAPSAGRAAIDED